MKFGENYYFYLKNFILNFQALSKKYNSPSPWTDVICLPSRNKSILERYGEGPLSITTSLRTRRFVGCLPLVTSSFFLMMIHLSLLRRVSAACPSKHITSSLTYNHNNNVSVAWDLQLAMLIC